MERRDTKRGNLRQSDVDPHPLLLSRRQTCTPEALGESSKVPERCNLIPLNSPRKMSHLHANDRHEMNENGHEMIPLYPNLRLIHRIQYPISLTNQWDHRLHLQVPAAHLHSPNGKWQSISKLIRI